MVKATPCPARSDRRKIRLNLSMPLRNPRNTPISPVPDFAIHCGSSVLTIKRSLIALYNDVYDEHLFVFAAGLSYYFVLSLFPLLVSMASLLGYVPIPHLFEGLLGLMARLVPGSDARDDDLLSDVKLRDSRSDLLNYTNALVAENASIGHGRKIPFQDVKIGSANRRSRNPHDGIACILNCGARRILPRSEER